MHGTGTALGDPIEINAAVACLIPSAKPHRATAGRFRQPLMLSAAKSSAGHAEAAAGIVGVACAALALEAQMSPPLLHLRRATRSYSAPMSCNAGPESWAD